MKFLKVCGLLLAAALTGHAQDEFADSVVSYVAGSGTNLGFETAFTTNTNAVLGAPASGATITVPAYTASQIVGVGTGGEITVEFNTPITNDPVDHADGMDFTIFGNDFFPLNGTTLGGIYNHTGLTVWVSTDDVTFYQLVAPDGLAHGADDYFPTEGSGIAGLPVNTSLTPSSFAGITAAQALSLYGGSAGGASYSISWAETASGSAADLSSVSYIKIEGSTGYGYIDAISRVESVQAVPEGSNILLILLGGGFLFFMRLGKGWRRHGLQLAMVGAVLTIGGRAWAQDTSFSFSNIQFWAGSGTDESALVISWNDGIAPDSLVFGYKWNMPASGDGPTMYDMMQAIAGTDSLLSFTPVPQFNSPDNFTIYSAFYDLTGQGGATVGTPGRGGTEDGSAPAGDHYEEGWFTGYWGVLVGTGNPYDGGSWDAAPYGVSYDSLSNDAWFGISFSTDMENFTIPDPGLPNAVFPVSVPEPTTVSLGAVGLIGCWKWKRLTS